MCIHGHVHANADPASASVASAATARAYWVGNVQLPPLCSARPSPSEPRNMGRRPQLKSAEIPSFTISSIKVWHMVSQ